LVGLFLIILSLLCFLLLRNLDKKTQIISAYLPKVDSKWNILTFFKKFFSKENFTFPTAILILFAITAFVYNVIFNFNENIVNYFSVDKSINSDQLAIYKSMIYYMAFSAPVFGIIIDTSKALPLWVLYATLFVAVSFIIILFSSILIVPLGIMGFGYAIFSSVLWTATTLYIDPNKEQYGKIIGTMSSLMALGFSFLPIIASIIITVNGYQALVIFETVLSCLCIVLAFILLLMKKGSE